MPGTAAVKIRETRATPVRVRRSPRFLPKTAHGEFAASDYVILEVETDDGLTGIGEVTCSPRWNGEEAAGTVTLVRDLLDPAIRGLDPWNWAAIAARLKAVLVVGHSCGPGSRWPAWTSPDARKTCGWWICSVAHTVDVIATKFVLPGRETAIVRDMARDLNGLGVDVVKVKVGLGVAADIARVAAVREELGPMCGLPSTPTRGGSLRRHAPRWPGWQRPA